MDQWFRRRCHLMIFLILRSGSPFVGRSETICAILIEGIMGNISAELFDFGLVVQEMSFKDISYLELEWQPLCSAELNHLCNFGRGSYEKHFCEIILNLDLWFSGCCLKDFFYLKIWRPFFQQSRTIYAILEEGIMGNIYFKFGPVI